MGLASCRQSSNATELQSTRDSPMLLVNSVGSKFKPACSSDFWIYLMQPVHLLCFKFMVSGQA